MLPGPVAESEARFDSKLSNLFGEKDTESRSNWMQLSKMSKEGGGFGIQDFEANTELRHSSFCGQCQLGSHLR